MMTQYMSLAMAKRAFVEGGQSWGSWRIGLGTATEKALTEASSVDAVGELDAEQSPGYARVPGSWSIEDTDDGPLAKLAVPADCFANEGEEGDPAWQTARCLFAVASVDGTERLMLVQDVEPFALQPGQSAGLDGNVMIVEWKAVDSE